MNSKIRIDKHIVLEMLHYESMIGSLFNEALEKATSAWFLRNPDSSIYNKDISWKYYRLYRQMFLQKQIETTLKTAQTVNSPNKFQIFGRLFSGSVKKFQERSDMWNLLPLAEGFLRIVKFPQANETIS